MLEICVNSNEVPEVQEAMGPQDLKYTQILNNRNSLKYYQCNNEWHKTEKSNIKNLLSFTLSKKNGKVISLSK